MPLKHWDTLYHYFRHFMVLAGWRSLFGGIFSFLPKNILHGNEHIVTLFFTVFSLGIGLGSLAHVKNY